MKLEHVAIWTHQLEALREFYEEYFGAVANAKFISDKEFTGAFESHFLTFTVGPRLVLMTLTDMPPGDNQDGYESKGHTHLAFSAKRAGA